MQFFFFFYSMSQYIYMIYVSLITICLETHYMIED